MKSAPCVRLAMRISPKMSEKPAAKRNSRPPSARLFSVWIAQYCTGQRFSEEPNGAPAFAGATVSGRDSRLQVLGRRPVARVDRVLQKLLGPVGPELADVRIGVDHRVHQAAFLARDAPNVNIADHIAVLVEGHRPAAGVGLDRAHRL